MLSSASVLRQIPNGISVARIIATPILVVLALAQQQEAFKWLLLVAFISDIFDGLIARSFSMTSTLGTRLDTMADSLLWLAAIAGIWQFYPELMTDYWPAAALMIGFWVAEHVVALMRYGKLTSFHTDITRISAYVVAVFVMTVFIWGVQPWLLYVAAAVCVIGSIEELLITFLLPEWTANMRGLYWVLAQRKSGML
jgi:phosphatidylglycerophosphate synthase